MGRSWVCQDAASNGLRRPTDIYLFIFLFYIRFIARKREWETLARKMPVENVPKLLFFVLFFSLLYFSETKEGRRRRNGQVETRRLALREALVFVWFGAGCCLATPFEVTWINWKCLRHFGCWHGGYRFQRFDLMSFKSRWKWMWKQRGMGTAFLKCVDAV